MRSERPRVELPYPPGISPDSEASRAHTLHWVEVRGLASRPDTLRAYDQMILHRLAARAYPNARGAELDLINDWQAWFFLFDDLFDGSMGRDLEAVDTLVEEHLALLQPTKLQPYPVSPFSSSFGELWERSSMGMSEAWKARCARNHTRYLRSYQREAQDRLQGVPGDLASYLDTRRDSIGVSGSLDLCERVGGYELSPTLHDSEPMASMRLLCAEIILITNDIYSAPKEAASEQLHNMVLLWMRDSHCDLAAAEDWATGILAERVRAFEQAEQRMRQGVQTGADWSNIDRHVAGMKSWMRANLDWSCETPRYSSAEHRRALESA
jgi:hypothetical protein